MADEDEKKKAKTIGSIDFQAENVQAVDYASIQKQPKAEKNKGKVKAIVDVVSFLAALLTCIYILWWFWTKFLA